MAYMAMASGSPWVVPSLEKMVSPLMYRLVSARYVLMRTFASAEDISERCLAVEGVKGIGSIYLNNSIKLWQTEYLLHGMYCSFASSFKTCAELKLTYCILDITFEGGRYRFAYDSTQDFPYSDGPHSRAFA